MFDKLIEQILLIWRFITPFHWIAPWEGGVRITYPKFLRYNVTRWEPASDNVEELKPGIHFKVPGFERVHQTITASQPLNLPPQSVTTKDGRKLNMSGVFIYSIKSVQWFFTRIHDQDDYLRDAGLRAMFQVVSARTMQEIMGDLESTANAVLLQAKQNTRGKGYDLESFGFSDLQEGKSLRILFGEGHNPYDLG
jgi:regulator of protease activity HflC (stomatin/prohibitin superfamily)